MVAPPLDYKMNKIMNCRAFWGEKENEAGARSNHDGKCFMELPCLVDPRSQHQTTALPCVRQKSNFPLSSVLFEDLRVLQEKREFDRSFFIKWIKTFAHGRTLLGFWPRGSTKQGNSIKHLPSWLLLLLTTKMNKIMNCRAFWGGKEKEAGARSNHDGKCFIELSCLVDPRGQKFVPSPRP